MLQLRCVPSFCSTTNGRKTGSLTGEEVAALGLKFTRAGRGRAEAPVVMVGSCTKFHGLGSRFIILCLEFTQTMRRKHKCMPLIYKPIYGTRRASMERANGAR
jgi:hypothetical protein